jgi:hypothetical protein
MAQAVEHLLGKTPPPKKKKKSTTLKITWKLDTSGSHL